MNEPKAVVELAAAELLGPGVVFCPNPRMTLWSNHPKVFIDVATDRRGTLPVLRHGLPAEGGREAARRALKRRRRACRSTRPLCTPQALPAAAALLQSIARQVPGLLYQYELAPGRRGRLTYISARGHELFGLTVDEVLEDIQVLWRAVDVDDQRRMLEALRQSAAALSEWRCEFRVHRGDGQQRWMLGTAMPERRADGVRRLVRLCRGRHRAPRTRAGAARRRGGRRGQPRQDRIPVAHEP